MSRWTVNPVQLVRNLYEARRLGASPTDSLEYLRWLYSDKAFGRLKQRRYLSLRLPPPIGTVRLAVRDNRGADQLVFGEVLIKLDYGVEVPEPGTVLDLGGNIGMATLYFARRWPHARLAVVEPAPANLEVLRENLSLNGVSATVFPAAVAAADGNLFLKFGNLDCAHRVTDEQSGPGVDVEALSVPTMMERLGWDRIGFLKIDIEGYEATLLTQNAGWLHRVDALCLEAFDQTIGESELNEIAVRFGFRHSRLDSGIHLWIRPGRP